MSRVGKAAAIAGSAVAIVSLLGGCMHTTVSEAILRPLEPSRTRMAEVHLAKDPPTRPFYEVALVQAVGFASDASSREVLHALALRGGQLGCDLVVGVTVDQGYTLAHAYGVCARYSPTGASGVPGASVPSRTSPAADTSTDTDEPRGGLPGETDGEGEAHESGDDADKARGPAGVPL